MTAPVFMQYFFDKCDSLISVEAEYIPQGFMIYQHSGPIFNIFVGKQLHVL